MRALRKFGLAAAVSMLLVGCRHAPVSYQLLRQGPTTLLIPPAEAASDIASAFEVRIRNARKKPMSKTDCEIEDSLITLRWDGHTAVVHLKSETYSPGPGSQAALGDSALPGMYLASEQSLEASRNDLLNLEAKGCLTSKEGQHLRLALVERLLLPPDVAYLLRFGGYGVTGVFDLNPDFRLQVIGPVYATGTPPSNKQLIGHETANYVFASAKKDDRVRISLGSVTETEEGQTTPFRKSLPQNAFPFPESFAYFRLLFRTEASSANRIATIISATDKMQLDEATRQRESGPADSCQGVSVPNATCIALAPDFGVNAEMRVHLNGDESFVRVGGTVEEAISLVGNVTAVPKSLMVRRLFQGHLVPVKFDPASNDILDLVLMPGDEITW